MGIENRSDETSKSVLQQLKEKYPDAVLDTMMPQGDAMAVIDRKALGEIVDFLKNDSGLLFDILIDITAVDYLGKTPRFAVVYHFLSMRFNRRLRLKVFVEENDPLVDSLTPLWGSANWLEREVWDMFGIRFRGHPDLKRILMYEEFQGHPLRKDYPIHKRQPLIGPKV
jgi:NADH-quinone oxidoreductase subunit C